MSLGLFDRERTDSSPATENRDDRPVTAGAFDLDEDDKDGRFNLVPNRSPIPPEQHKVQLRFYDTWNVLKLLKTRGEFDKDDAAFNDIVTSLKECARAGCTGPHPNPDSALEAFDQIRGYVLALTGRGIVNRYLAKLALWAVGGIIVGALLRVIREFADVPGLGGYGWVIIGSMAGAWVSVANRRRDISFDEIPEFLDRQLEPFVRMLFVAVIATMIALSIRLELVTIKFGRLEFAKFYTHATLALLIGLIAGVSERALSVRLIKRLADLGASGTASLL